MIDDEDIEAMEAAAQHPAGLCPSDVELLFFELRAARAELAALREVEKLASAGDGVCRENTCPSCVGSCGECDVCKMNKALDAVLALRAARAKGDGAK